MKKQKIIKNSIRCKSCGDVLESKHVHDFVQCRCGACAADGGKDYLRRLFKTEDCYEELSIVEEIED